MQNSWDEAEAAQYRDDPLGLRAYTSRLLGREADLVLHGGGNTSLKHKAVNLFGEEEELLYVKGSGWDLSDIEKAGFAPVRLDVLRKMAQLESLSDTDMVTAQRAAMTDPGAPTPSVEAILHAVIPFKYVDHTHADAVVTLTNTPSGEQRIRELYGDKVLIVPYIMPGFVLARRVYELTQGIDWGGLHGMVLMNHGIFSFADEARESYTRMIDLVSAAEDYLKQHITPWLPAETPAAEENLPQLALIRRKVSRLRRAAVVMQWNHGAEALDFSRRNDLAEISQRGPLTPDHVIRTKRTPALLDGIPETELEEYAQAYIGYFDRNTNGSQQCLNPTACWAVWPGHGTLCFGRSLQEARIIDDITTHTLRAIVAAESLESWQALPEKDIFEVEYWELEQAKLRKSAATPPLQGKIALVTGAASGIGKACVESLVKHGAVAAALDIKPEVTEQFQNPNVLGLLCDITSDSDIQNAVEETVRRFGGLDILVSNAGIFPAGELLANMQPETWDSSIAINLTSHQRLLTACAPYLELGVEPAVVMIASKNVPAPGPGAAAYSAAKAGQTQLARVAALELGKAGVRVNILHPNAVFDTAIWTQEVLDKRAAYYGMNVQEYKTHNILKTEITSHDVAELACALAGPLFAKTTGAQIPIDGGNERVI